MFPGDDTSITYINLKIDILIFKGTNILYMTYEVR